MPVENQFESVDKLALAKFNIKIPVYGESWKFMPIHELQERLREECAECLEGRDLKEVHEEALDVLNIARMIAMRTKEVSD